MGIRTLDFFYGLVMLFALGADLAPGDGSALLLALLTGHTGALLSGHHLTLLLAHLVR